MKKSIKLCTLIAACLIMGGTISAAKNKAAPTAATTNGSQAFHKGAFYLGGALGLGSGLGYLGGVAFIANAEYGVADNIGVGGSVGYWSYSSESFSYAYATSTFPYSATGTYKYTYSIIPIIATGAWHFRVGVPKLDLAAGVSLGYYIVSVSPEVLSGGGTTAGLPSASGSGVAWGVFGLARYFFTDHLAVRGKLGYGITVVEVGVDFRF